MQFLDAGLEIQIGGTTGTLQRTLDEVQIVLNPSKPVLQLFQSALRFFSDPQGRITPPDEKMGHFQTHLFLYFFRGAAPLFLLVNMRIFSRRRRRFGFPPVQNNVVALDLLFYDFELLRLQ